MEEEPKDRDPEDPISEFQIGARRPPEPEPEKPDKRLLLLAFGGSFAVALSMVVWVGRHRGPEAIANGPSVSKDPQKYFWENKLAAGGERVASAPGGAAAGAGSGAGARSADADAPVTVDQFMNILGAKASADKRDAFLDAIRKDPISSGIIKDFAERSGGRFTVAKMLSALNSNAAFRGLAGKFGIGPGGLAPGRFGRGLDFGAVGSAASGRDFGSGGTFAGAGAGAGSSYDAGAGRFGSGGRRESGDSRRGILAQALSAANASGRQMRSSQHRDGNPTGVPNVQTRLNGGQWGTQLALAGAAVPDDFGYKPHAWAALDETDRQSLKDLETQDHNQPGPEVPAGNLANCSGTWCMLRSCGKHCVYCYHKYPDSGNEKIGCGGPQHDYDGANHDTIRAFCKFGAASDGACRQACEGDHNPPCDKYNGPGP